MKRILMGLALVGLMAGCASYDDDHSGQGSPGVGSDRTLGTGDSGQSEIWTQTNSFPGDMWPEPYGRMGDSPH